MSYLPCLGCGWCCLHDQCPESHILHGYLARCPEIGWDELLGLYRCRLADRKKYRELLHMGLGCCAPLNPWRGKVREREEESGKEEKERGREEESGEEPFLEKRFLPRTPASKKL